MEKVRLGDIVDTIQGSQYPVDEQIYIRKEGYERFLRISDYTKINEPERFVKYTGKELICTEEDVVVVRYGNIGSIGIGKAGILANNLFALKKKGNKDIISKYIYYFLRSKKINNVLVNKANSSTMPALTHKMIKELEIPIYTKELEIKIVKELDKVQEIIDLRKKQIEQLDKLSKSQFVEMFQSGNYPKDELGKLCDVRDGTHDSPKYLEKSGYKFITSKNIINNEIDFSEVKYISKQDYDKFNTRFKVNYGDILMPMIGTIGKPMIVNIPDDEIDFAIKNVALIKFLDNSQVTNIYIKNLFDSDYFENAILQNKRGGTQKFIALSDIRKMQIEIPPIELQNQFAYIVKQIDKQKFILEKSLKKLEEMQESLMNKYFE